RGEESFEPVTVNVAGYGNVPNPSRGRFAMAEDEDAILRLLEGIRSFGWHENKRKSNLQKHKLDFMDACRVFDNPVVVHRSDRHGEVRYQVLGTVEGRE